MAQNTNKHGELEKEMAATSKTVARRARENRPANTTKHYNSYGKKFVV